MKRKLCLLDEPHCDGSSSSHNVNETIPKPTLVSASFSELQQGKKKQRTSSLGSASTLSAADLAPLRASLHLTLLVFSFLNGADLLRKACYPIHYQYRRFLARELTSTVIQLLFTKISPHNNSTANGAKEEEAPAAFYRTRFTCIVFQKQYDTDYWLSKLLANSPLIYRLIPVIKFLQCFNNGIDAGLDNLLNRQFQTELAASPLIHKRIVSLKLQWFDVHSLRIFKEYFCDNVPTSTIPLLTPHQPTQQATGEATTTINQFNKQRCENFKHNLLKLSISLDETTNFDELLQNKSWLVPVLKECKGNIVFKCNATFQSPADILLQVKQICKKVNYDDEASQDNEEEEENQQFRQLTSKHLQLRADFDVFMHCPSLRPFIKIVYARHNDKFEIAEIKDNYCREIMLIEQDPQDLQTQHENNQVQKQLIKFEATITGKFLSPRNLSEFKLLKTVKIYHCDGYLSNVLMALQFNKTIKHLQILESNLTFLEESVSVENYETLVQNSGLESLKLHNCKIDALSYVVGMAPHVKLFVDFCSCTNATVTDLVLASVYCDELCSAWYFDLHTKIELQGVKCNINYDDNFQLK